MCLGRELQREGWQWRRHCHPRSGNCARITDLRSGGCGKEYSRGIGLEGGGGLVMEGCVRRKLLEIESVVGWLNLLWICCGASEDS